MTLGLLLVIIGIAIAILVHWGLGVLVIIVGLALLIAPAVQERRYR